MEFRTKVDIEKAPWSIDIGERLLFVGSCFADNIGSRFREEQFDATVNPFGVMYNPISVLHTVERLHQAGEHFDAAFLTFGTNHIYILKETGKVVDNCQKRPQRLFEERALSVEECREAIEKTIGLLREMNPEVKVVLTVSPIRYAKYGFHGSQLSKATLLLAVGEIAAKLQVQTTTYFPSYEIVLDELRDYRFYKEDMLHPSAQAIEYIWQRMTETVLSERALRYLEEYRPIKQALAHRPFDAESDEYKEFKRRTMEQWEDLKRKYKI